MAPLHSLCLLESTAGRPAQRNRNLQKMVKVMQKVGKTEHLIDYLGSCIFTNCKTVCKHSLFAERNSIMIFFFDTLLHWVTGENLTFFSLFTEQTSLNKYQLCYKVQGNLGSWFDSQPGTLGGLFAELQ